ncbi:hypothetical protein [Iodobacter ciconiae]|uniref:Uncharacterized protein n=1 Tax=Iodobacter ciconiae TaxID=2496266 RepID=A0A3S8ZT01_9NEIS|nr:hypothetical protein [Iodobacter ciconiae]AZN36612.1 hypothetical protein EJO50_08950 [Iodobacter ciconiae]
MMRFLFLLLLCTHALAGPLQLESRTMTSNTLKQAPAYTSAPAEGAITMPYVAGGSDVASRINDALYLAVIGIATPLKSGKTFPLTEGSGELNGMASLDFNVQRNDGRILSLDIEAEGCGAYCEAYVRSYSFDAATGRALSAIDLFTPGGLSVVAKEVLVERKRSYSEEIKSLKRQQAELKRKKAKADDLADIDERIDFNKRCLEREKENQQSSPQQDVLSYARFSLPQNKAVFTTGRCSAHVNRALDDVGDISLAILPKDLTALLNPYGKFLLLGQAAAVPADSLFAQVLHGKIGSAAITMRLEIPNGDGSFSGVYFYDKYRKVIALRGMKKGATLELIEQVAEKDQAKLSLNIKGNQLVGQWQGNSKQIPAILGW